SADEQGLVTLRGEVATVEDKLTASRCLKGLDSCTAIVNSLDVTPLRHAGHTVTLVTRDGQHAVHGALVGSNAKPAPVILSASRSGVARPDTREPAPVPYVLPPAPTPTLPSGLPANRMRVQVFRGGHPTMEEARPIRYISPSGYATAPAETRGY